MPTTGAPAPRAKATRAQRAQRSAARLRPVTGEKEAVERRHVRRAFPAGLRRRVLPAVRRAALIARMTLERERRRRLQKRDRVTKAGEDLLERGHHLVR